MPEVKKDINKTSGRQESGLGMLFRIFWFFLGNLILIILLVWILETVDKSIGLKDLFYFITVFLLLAVRYFDITFLNGLTAKGDPASISHWYRYAIALTAIAALLWVIVHVAKYFL